MPTRTLVQRGFGRSWRRACATRGATRLSGICRGPLGAQRVRRARRCDRRRPPGPRRRLGTDRVRCPLRVPRRRCGPRDHRGDARAPAFPLRAALLVLLGQAAALAVIGNAGMLLTGAGMAIIGVTAGLASPLLGWDGATRRRWELPRSREWPPVAGRQPYRATLPRGLRPRRRRHRRRSHLSCLRIRYGQRAASRPFSTLGPRATT